MIEKYSYDAFGKPKVTDWDGGNARSTSHYHHRFLFQGREHIGEVGVYDYRNRFYHPELGRFLQKDPIGFDAGDMNLFRYCGDDPIDGSDPTGLQDQDDSRPVPHTLTSFGRGDCISGANGLSYSDKARHFSAGVITITVSSADEGVKSVVKVAVKAHKSVVDWTKKVQSAVRMTAELLTGKGPSERVFGADSPESNDLRSDPKYEPALKKAMASGQLENVDFHPHGPFDAGLHPTRQFVGSYQVGVNGKAAFIYNQTSAWSLFGHARFLPWWGHERPGPLGNITQVYVMGPDPSSP